MTKAIQLVTRVPFEGFYCSKYSDLIDQEETQFAEYELESNEEGREGAQPKAVRLEASELCDLLMRHTDYSEAQHTLARHYIDGFSQEAGDILGIDLQLKFETMSSPREYNFSTDRLFAYVPLKVMRQLFAKSKADGHKTLAAHIKDSFTFRDGFIPHYSNQLCEWLEKPLTDWDHNELCTLLEAALILAECDDDELNWAIYYPIAESCGYSAWSDAVDWAAFEAAREEARQDKLDDIEADLEDWERAEIEARSDWRTGDVIAHPEQAALL